MYGVFFLYPAVTMPLDSNSYSLWQTLHSDCKTLPVMLTVECLLSLDSPCLPSLSIHSHTFPACSSLIAPDSLKAAQLETSGGAVNYSVDIFSSACVCCVCVCSSVLKCSWNTANLSVTCSHQSVPALCVCVCVYSACMHLHTCLILKKRLKLLLSEI